MSYRVSINTYAAAQARAGVHALPLEGGATSAGGAARLVARSTRYCARHRMAHALSTLLRVIVIVGLVSVHALPVLFKLQSRRSDSLDKCFYHASDPVYG